MVKSLLIWFLPRMLGRALVIVLAVIIALVFHGAGFGAKPRLLDAPVRLPVLPASPNSAIVVLQPVVQQGWIILEVRSYPMTATLDSSSHAPSK